MYQQASDQFMLLHQIPITDSRFGHSQEDINKRQNLYYDKMKEGEYIRKNFKNQKESAFSLYDGISNHE